MKLQILELDPHDDHVSTRDKLAWVKGDRVLLVWPPGGGILQRRLDLALVQREAAKRGLRLGLLTFDPVVRDHAQRLDIPVFDSLDELPEDRWRASAPPDLHEDWERPKDETRPELGERDSRRAAPGLPSNILRYSAVALAVLALLALAGALLPRATLLLDPATRAHSDSFSFTLAAGPGGTTASEAILAEEVSTAITVTRRIDTSGRRRVPGERAQGSLRFTNLTGEVVEIPAGTSARTVEEPPVRVITVEAAQLPAEDGSSVDVPAEAAEPGEVGNVASGAVGAVDGPLGLSVQVTNPTPFDGGTSRVEPAVTDGDWERLRELSRSEALASGGENLQESLGSSMRLAEGSLQITDILREEYDAEPGELAASLGLTLTTRVHGLAFSEEQVLVAVEERVTGEGDRRRLVPGSIVIGEIVSEAREGGATELEADVQWLSYEPVAREALRRAAAGGRIEEVESLGAAFNLDSIQATIWPRWLPRLPMLPSQISLRYVWQRGTAP